MKQLFFTIFTLLSVMLSAAPYIGYLYPATGTPGKTQEILVGGQNLKSLRSGFVTGDGVTVKAVKIIPGFPNPSGGQTRYLLDFLRFAAGVREEPPCPEDTSGWRRHPWWERPELLNTQERSIMMRDLCTRRDPLQASPSIRQMALVTLKIAPDAKPGRRELRLCGKTGVTPPLPFYIEHAEQYRELLFSAPGMPQEKRHTVALYPATINGQIFPGETDRFPVKLKAGERYTFRLFGRSLHPFIGDAVPGHFQPVLRLLNEKENEVAFADDFRAHPDPVMLFTAPDTGLYTLEIRDNLYRGREDFVYFVRLEHGTRLPSIQAPADGKEYVEASQLRHGRLPQIPAAVTGVLKKPGDSAEFHFTGRAGEQLAIHTFIRRQGSPMDGKLQLFAPDGKSLAENDDTPEKPMIGEYIQQLDPQLQITLPASGQYRIKLSDTTGKCGSDYRYFLTVGAPQPDFAVYTTTSSVGAGGGKLKLQVLRRDGFRGEIKITSPDRNVLIRGNTVIAADQDTLEITPLRTTKTKLREPRQLKLEASAVIDGRTVTHPVIPADEYNQAFAYMHLLPAEELYW